MLIVLSLDHHHSSVAARERFMLQPDAQRRLGRLVRRAGGGQVAFLVTCNRVEIITEVVAEHPSRAIAALVAFAHRLAPDLAEPFLSRARCLTGDGAARHLFRVAAGLESQVPGDEQVLAQVRAAYAHAVASGLAGQELHRVFQCALRAAKRVHAETGLGRRRASVGAVAAGEIARRFDERVPGRGEGVRVDGPPARRVVLLGAGKMAERAAQALKAVGCSLTIINRDLQRAGSLARTTGAAVRPFAHRYAAAAESEAILVTTGAPEPTLGADLLQQARLAAGRPESALLVMDLGVPRNVEPATATLRGVTLLGLEDLTPGDAPDDAALACHAAEGILEDELGRFASWLGARRSRLAQVA